MSVYEASIMSVPAAVPGYVKVVTPLASVTPVPVRPACGPLMIVNVTVFPATGTSFSLTVAVTVWVVPTGFSSVVGRRELEPAFPVLGTALDLFRFRPGTTTGTFGTAQRILSSGGEHRFFAGESEIALSTGRTDGSGGDQQQAGHWKAASITNTRLGIMDPQVAAGLIVDIGANDLLAFDTIAPIVAGSSTGRRSDSVERHSTSMNSSTAR